MVQTPELSAVVRSGRKEREADQFSISDATTGKFTLYSAAPLGYSMYRTGLVSMAGYLFGFGTVPFDEALERWKEKGTIDRYTPAEESESGFHEFELLNWRESTIGAVEVHVHPEHFTIERFGGNFSGNFSHLWIPAKHTTVEGLRFPLETVRKMWPGDIPANELREEDIETTITTRSYVPDELAKFEPEMLTLEYYGLKSPSFVGLRPPPRSYRSIILIGIAAALVVGGFFDTHSIEASGHVVFTFQAKPARLYADRTACLDRDHRNSDRDASARGAGGSRTVATDAV